MFLLGVGLGPILANEGRDWGPLRCGIVMLFCCCCEMVRTGGVGVAPSSPASVILPRLKLRVLLGFATGGGGGGLAVGCLGLAFCGGGGGGAALGLLGVTEGGGGGGPGFLMELVEEDGLALGVNDGVEFCKIHPS